MADERKRGPYNPVEVKVWMKRINKGRDHFYYIGNSDMDISLLDCVLKFVPPRDETKPAMLIINNVKDRGRDPHHNNDDNDDWGPDD